MSVANEILNQALALPKPERAALVHQLLLSLEPEDLDEDSETASAANIGHITNGPTGVKNSPYQVTNEVEENDPAGGDVEHAPPHEAQPVGDPDLVAWKENQEDTHQPHHRARRANYGSRIADQQEGQSGDRPQQQIADQEQPVPQLGIHGI